MGIAFVAMVFGQLYLAMPLSIVGENFQDAYEDYQQNRRRKLKRHDTTLSPFDSVKLHRISQRLCGIQYHLLGTWRVIQLNLDKVARKGHELIDLGANGARTNKRSTTSGQTQLVIALVEAQMLRLTKIKDAVDKFSDTHGEACNLLQVFVPHGKRKPRLSVAVVSSGGDSFFAQVFGRAKRTITAHFGSSASAPDPRVLAESYRGQLWLALEVPDSSRVATAINRAMMGFALLSVWIFFCESLPELASSGIETRACQRVVKAYCTSRGIELHDSGCFVRFPNNTADWTTPLDFSCEHGTECPSCYGNGLNFGSHDAAALSCVDAFHRYGADLICFRMQCMASAATIVNMEPYWIYFEWLFGFNFLCELILRFYACHHRRRFFKDIYNVFDVLAVLPFGVELCGYIFFRVKPMYAIEATEPTFLSAIRVFKTVRILKLTRHFRGTKVLAQTAKETWRQLLIPVRSCLPLAISCLISRIFPWFRYFSCSLCAFSRQRSTSRLNVVQSATWVSPVCGGKRT
jgi:hypothetical protein